MTRIPLVQVPPCFGKRRRSRAQLVAAFSLTLVSVPGAAFAESLPSTGLEEIGQKVSDSDLSDMRGKFITSSSIAYFGVQMTTNWQGADGITTVANLVFTLNFTSGQPNPQVLVGWTRQGDPAMDVASAAGATPANSAFGTSGGAVQSTVIAGSDNNAINKMTIEVAPAQGLNQTIPAGLSPASASETRTFANGDKLQFVVSSGSIGLAIGNGPSGATQMISGDIGRATQTIALLNNNNNALNNMSMVVGLGPVQDLAGIQAAQALLSHVTMGF